MHLPYRILKELIYKLIYKVADCQHGWSYDEGVLGAKGLSDMLALVQGLMTGTIQTS